MDRRLAALVLILLSSGCQQTQPPAYDPFLGPTRVPPPGTMTPPVVTAPPYYSGSSTATPTYLQPTSPPANLSAPPISSPITPGVPVQSPTARPSSIPQSGYSFPQSSASPSPTEARLARMAAARSGQLPPVPPVIDLDAMTADASFTAPDRVTPVAHQQIAVQPQPVQQASLQQPVRQEPIKIVEPVQPVPAPQPKLQPRQAENFPTQHAATVVPSTNVQASSRAAVAQPSVQPIPAAQAPVRSPAPTSAAPTKPVSRYARNENYSVLSGKLEHSSSTGRWKLRYIPVDGETDDYGGSVEIDDASGLQNFKPGEFVTITGAISEPSGGVRSFAPTYRLQSIQRQ